MTMEGLLSLIFVALAFGVWELERIRKNLDEIKLMIRTEWLKQGNANRWIKS